MAFLVGNQTPHTTRNDSAAGDVIIDREGVVAAASGDASKAFFRIGLVSIMSAGAKAKVLIYDSGGDLLGASAEYTFIGSESDDTLVEVAVSPAVTIVASSTYYLGLFTGVSTFDFRMQEDGGYAIDAGNTYPTAPDPITQESTGWGIRPIAWLESSDTASAPKRSLLLGIG